MFHPKQDKKSASIYLLKDCLFEGGSAAARGALESDIFVKLWIFPAVFQSACKSQVMYRQSDVSDGMMQQRSGAAESTALC